MCVSLLDAGLSSRIQFEEWDSIGINRYPVDGEFCSVLKREDCLGNQLLTAEDFIYWYRTVGRQASCSPPTVN